MKVIGTTKDGYMITATRDEVANLLGFYFGGQEGCPRIAPGDEIETAGMFHQLYDLARKKDSLTDVAKELRTVAALLEARNPIIAGAVDEEPDAL